MPSKKPVEPLDSLETDVPTTPDDNEALWRLRDRNTMDSHAYLAFLRRFAKDRGERELTDPDAEPFEL